MNVTYYKRVPKSAKIMKKFNIFGHTFALVHTALGSNVFLLLGGSTWTLFYQAAVEELFKKLPPYRQKRTPAIVRKQLSSKASY